MAHIGKARLASMLARRLCPTKNPAFIEALTLDIISAFDKPTKQAAVALCRTLETFCELPESVIEVDSLEEHRDIISVGRTHDPNDPGKYRIRELAVGDTTYTLFVRSPTVESGAHGKKKLHAVRISAELAEEMYPERFLSASPEVLQQHKHGHADQHNNPDE